MLKSKSWALLGAGVVIAVSAIAVTLYIGMPGSVVPAHAADAPAAPPPTPVTVVTVKAHNVTTWQDFSGRLEAVNRVELRSRVAGAVNTIHFREGSLVKAGDLLVTIDPAPYQAAVAQAESQVAAAQARQDLAASELERGKALSANNTISKSDVMQRQSTFTEAAAQVQAAKAALQAARLDLGYTEIRAPISGKIGRIEVTPGNLVAAGSGSPVLTTLVSVDPVYASASASEELLTRVLSELPVKDGLPDIAQVPVEIHTLADETQAITGHLQLIDNEVEAASGTIRFRAVFDNSKGLLLPGQFVRIRMGEPKAEERLTISERAIGTDQDKKFVLVVGKDNVAAYRQIALGAAIGSERIVEKGLTAGERIVVNGLQRIRPGAPVAPQEEAHVAQQ